MRGISIQDCIRVGWETFKKRPWFFITAYVLMFGVILSFAYLTEEPLDSASVFGFLNTLASIVFGTILEVVLVNLALKAHDRIRTLEAEALFSPMPFWYYVATKIATGFVVFVGILLLIIPGVILALMFAFAPYLVVDRGLGPIEAMKESARVTKGHKWELLGLFIVLGILNVLGILVFVVGVLVTLPISAIALVHAYRTLEHKASEIVPTPNAAL